MRHRHSSAAVVISARVTAKQVETGLVRTAPVNESGYYVIASIPIGTYEITAEAAGFKRHQKTGISVTVNSSSPSTSTWKPAGWSPASRQRNSN
jgi:hypothetical protein